MYSSYSYIDPYRGTLLLVDLNATKPATYVGFNTFYNNSTNAGAAAVSISGSNVMLANNTAVGNTALNSYGVFVAVNRTTDAPAYNTNVVAMGNIVMGNKAAVDIFVTYTTTGSGTSYATISSAGNNIFHSAYTRGTTAYTVLQLDPSDIMVDIFDVPNILTGSMPGDLFVASPFVSPAGKIAPVVMPKTDHYAQSWLKIINVSYLNTFGTNGGAVGSDYYDQTGTIIPQTDNVYSSGSVNIPGILDCVRPSNKTWYVATTSDGGDPHNDGITPLTPKANISSVLNLSCVEEGDTIKVMHGSYIVGLNVGVQNQSQRDAGYYVSKNLHILGGYDDNTYTTRTLRSSILTGEIGIPGIVDNAYNIFIWNTDPNLLPGSIDGFEIRDANSGNTANPFLTGNGVSIARKNGAGILVNAGKLSITNNKFSNNNAFGNGAAIYVENNTATGA
jgi:hypothetical protein